MSLPETPEDWIAFLIPKLRQQAEMAAFYRRYYAGDHRISEATARFREIFGRYFTTIADNWCQVVVDSAVERLQITGFRFGDTKLGEFGLEIADKDAWELWQKNSLDVKQRIIHTEAAKCGVAFILVDKTGDEPMITGESPLEVYVHCHPAHGERLAAIKQWKGDDKHAYVTLYLPDATHKFKSVGQVRGMTGKPMYDGIGANIPNPDGVVPMIPVENAPDMCTGGTSDLEVVIPIQDRVNKLCLDLDVGSEFHAAPQRWAAGWEPPADADGNPLPDTQIQAATSRFLAFSDPDTKVGSLPPGDPGAYVQPIEMYIQHIAALSKVPPHYLLGKMANLSGDALKAAETGLVSKVMGKMDDYGDAWEEAIGLALGKDSSTAEVIWRNPESRTFAQLVDGVIKLHDSLNVPRPMAFEMIGMSPQQIERAEKYIKENPPEPSPMNGQLPPGQMMPPGQTPNLTNRPAVMTDRNAAVKAASGKKA